MPSPPAPTTAAVEWSLLTAALGSLAVQIARLRIELALPRSTAGAAPLLLRAWFDTGAPLSVIPNHVQRLGLRWQPLPGVRTTWLNQPCEVGYINVWLVDWAAGILQGPYPLLAKFPQR